MSKCVKELEKAIRDHFSFLLRGGFRFGKSAERRWDEECFVILTSDSYKYLFTSEKGLMGIFVGRHDAPDQWNDHGWYDLGNVLDFIEGKIHTLSEILAFDKHMNSLAPNERMEYWSRRLSVMEPKIREIFADQAEAKIQDLEEFLRKQEAIIDRDLKEQFSQIP